MKTRFANLLTFLGAVAMQVAFVWQDPKASFTDKLAATLVASLGLALASSKLLQVEQNIVAAAAIVGTVLTVAFAHFTPGSKAATVASVVLATVTSVRNLVTKDIATKTAAVAALAAGLSFTACHGTVKPDQVKEAVVDCAKIDAHLSPALPAVENCIAGIATENYAACLDALVAAGTFAANEVLCVVDEIFQPVAPQARTMLAARPSGTDTARARAGRWLTAQNVTILR